MECVVELVYSEGIWYWALTFLVPKSLMVQWWEGGFGAGGDGVCGCVWECIVWGGMVDVHPVIGECVCLVIFWAGSGVILSRCWTVGF